MSLLSALRVGDDWSTTLTARLGPSPAPAGENRPPHHLRSKGGHELSPWGNHLSTDPLGVENPKEAESEEARRPGVATGNREDA